MIMQSPFQSEILKLEKLFRQTYSENPDNISSLKGDGSERRIYRVQNEHRSIIAVAGDHRAENEAFIQFSKHFRSQGLPVPEIYATDLENGVYLEEDLGYETLFEWMSALRKTDGFSERIVEQYRNVLSWLPHFQVTAGQSLDFSFCYQHASFAWDSMQWDLQYFRHRFLEVFYRKPLNRQALQTDFDHLVHHLLEERADYFLYRDFQSRNVMIRDDRPYFIDYQSGRRGALEYDVASLLYDAKADIPEEIRVQLLTHYLNELNLVIDINKDRFYQYFYGFVLIRIMQAFGAYGYLAAVKGKQKFLKSVPFAIGNVERLLQKEFILAELPTLKTVFQDLVNDEKLRTLTLE
jgi:aminoglycoside/choline kinase family phosphotransferase